APEEVTWHRRRLQRMYPALGMTLAIPDVLDQPVADQMAVAPRHRQPELVQLRRGRLVRGREGPREAAAERLLGGELPDLRPLDGMGQHELHRLGPGHVWVEAAVQEDDERNLHRQPAIREPGEELLGDRYAVVVHEEGGLPNPVRAPERL